MQLLEINSPRMSLLSVQELKFKEFKERGNVAFFDLSSREATVF